MYMWKQLDAGISVAVRYHCGLYDKGGKPYILHAFYVMNALMYDPELATIGVLHDVIEDSNLTIEYFINLGYTQRVIDGLILLTHNPEDTYQEYIDKIATSYDAIRVKRKDLEHNSLITRLKGSRPKDLERIKKYHDAFIFLGKAKANFQ